MGSPRSARNPRALILVSSALALCVAACLHKKQSDGGPDERAKVSASAPRAPAPYKATPATTPAYAPPAQADPAPPAEATVHEFQDSAEVTYQSQPDPERARPPAAKQVAGSGHGGKKRRHTTKKKKASTSRASRRISLGAGDDPLAGQGTLYKVEEPKAISVDSLLPRATPAGDDYAPTQSPKFLSTRTHPLSTFAVDVDTASYANVRRMLTEGQRPPHSAIRIEEFINYFSYAYPQPKAGSPFAVVAEVARSPWASQRRLVHIGIQGRELKGKVPPRNLVFLIDVSGSMNGPDRLPLLVHGLSELTLNLRKQDRVSIVVYAGASGVVLNPTPGDERATILDSLHRLRAGGSTNGGAGLDLAYMLARSEFIKGGVNRVILATDGDFNVGNTGLPGLKMQIEAAREHGVFLTVLGFGRGNLGDATMELLADKGNGNYAYIDSAREAQKVLVRESSATLTTIAKDVKIQVEFNPAKVAGYRLLGYENRALAAKDFDDDRKDAGEIGAGHTVTALYELELVGDASATSKASSSELRYAKKVEANGAHPDELLQVKIRHKHPQGSKSVKMSVPVADRATDWSKTSADFRFAAAVATFAMHLRGVPLLSGPDEGSKTLTLAKKMASASRGPDPHGDRKEFLKLIARAKQLGY